MAGTSTPSTSNTHRSFFGAATTQDPDSFEFEHELEQLDEQRDQGQGARRPSAYVDVFESMVKTVLEHEHVLLSEQEIDALDSFRKFCYNTRYCLVRLVLRKPNQWYAISTLQRFEKEVGEDGLRSSMVDLCQPISCAMNTSYPNDPLVKHELVADVSVKVDEDSREIIDLAWETNEVEDREQIKGGSVSPTCTYNAEAGPSRLPMVPADPVQVVLQSNPANMNFDFFCEDESNMSLEDILLRLSKDQLLELVKLTRCKLPSRPKKADIIASLQRTAASQSVLTQSISQIRKGKGKNRDDGLHQSTLSFLSIRKLSRTAKSKMTQEHRLRQMALKLLGKCVRVNFDFYRLVRRISIICYRETEFPVSLMLPALLTVFKKRNYPPYEHTRDGNIWTCREDILEYEQALEVEKVLEQIMETQADTGGRRTTKTPDCGRDDFMTPGPRRAFTSPLITPGRVTDARPSETPRIKEEENDQTYLGVNEPEAEERPVIAISKNQKMVNYLKDYIFPKWRELLSIRDAQEGQSRSPALERFETGYVYTRMVDKATHSFGPLKGYEDELMVLNCLLSQKYWRRGKRAGWYVRRAIIQGHLWLRDKDNKVLLESIQGIREALSDEDTGMVWRPNLELRLIRLQNRLKLPDAFRFVPNTKLQKPQTIEVRAVRVYPTKFDSHGRLITDNDKEGPSEKCLQFHMSDIKKDSSEENKLETPKPAKMRLGQKSCWKGRGDQIVSVETRALEHYEDLGFKGFHCETKLLTTLFALLFWDVIFANIPGALETPFQDAPLDLCEDTFYYARKDLIEARLAEIRDGKGPEILQRHDEQYREKETWCVGLSWDLCGREDLVDIVKCLGGDSLSTICKLFCEDYRGRRSGGPDLFIWRAEQQLCKFVEVKGPGDTPQENQKLWFDGLLRANAAVEICKVIDMTTDKTPTRSRKRKAKTPTPASLSRRKKNTQSLDSDPDPEEEDYDRLDPEQERETYDSPEPNTRPGTRRRLNEIDDQ